MKILSFFTILWAGHHCEVPLAYEATITTQTLLCWFVFFFKLYWGNNCMLPLQLIYLQPASTAARCIRQPRCLWCQCWNPRDGWGWQYKNLDKCVTAEKELFPAALRTGEVPATPEIEGQTFFPASSSLSSKKYFLSQLLSVVCNHCRRPSIPSRLW